MKKFLAWTLIELLIALSIITILTGLFISNFKPATQNAKIFLFASLRNIMRANSWIMENKESMDGEGVDIGTNDWYCIQLADIFTLEDYNCSKSATADTVNLKFVNGVTIKGVATPWVIPYEEGEYQFKNIEIDIDGDKGMNRLWVDRFPMRVFKGSGYDGIIFPANCGSEDVVYDGEGNPHTIGSSAGVKSPYCSGNINFMKDDTVLTYDVFRAEILVEPTDDPATPDVDESQEDAKAPTMTVAALRSPAEADCGAYGGLGFYSIEACNSMGFKIYPKCASEETCTDCKKGSANICPEGTTDKETCVNLKTTTNPDDLPCYAIIHKPSAAMSMLVETVMGEIDTGY